MGLDIVSSDWVCDFHIGYVGFFTMRTYFVLQLSKELYDDYRSLAHEGYDSPVDEDAFSEAIGDLYILLSHSDCDGELSVDECRRLKEVLFVDEDLIKTRLDNEYNPRMIKLIKKQGFK